MGTNISEERTAPIVTGDGLINGQPSGKHTIPIFSEEGVMIRRPSLTSSLPGEP